MILLILGHTIPEPTTTAAGNRMLQLISIFQQEGYKIHFATSALLNPRSVDLGALNIALDVIKLNDPSFDSYIKNLNPDIVMYDRFVIEEHYGWRVAKHCPNAIRILDTEDLHFLRKAREAAIKKEGNLNNVDLYTDQSKRELASIMRCDISLIISKYEHKLLIDTFNVSESQLLYIPFLVEYVPDLSDFKSYEDRTGFMTIGNLLHTPNVDSVLYLNKFVELAVQVYTSKKLWKTLQSDGIEIIKQEYNQAPFHNALMKRMLTIKKNIQHHRKQNFIIEILQHQSMQATKYMSRWIEEKNK